MDKRIVLPKNLRPSNYKVTLIPGLETFRFSGQVSITLNVIESTKTIIANANDLEISSCRLVVLQSEKMLNWPVDEITQRPSIAAKEIKLNKEATTVEFHFEYEIPERAIAMLHVEFIGNHNDQMVGFYRSQYKDEQGNKKHLVVTQFEAVDCRRCFPCWDEPNLKATFDITLIVPKNTTALSNMNIIKQNDIKIGEYVLNCVEFATTPIMSTYLVAMAVGEFDYLEAVANPKLPTNSKPIVCRTYTLKGQSHLGKFSLDVAVKTLEFFSEYFDIAYPLPKMDMIAIPDFAAGAMENWGLVTYREEAVLFDPKLSDNDTKEEVAYTVGHELAHQWFGNLVTMDWWDELWLNEGFATFVGWLAVDKLFPEWNVFTNFVGKDYNFGATVDSQRSSHAIQVEVNSAAEIDQIFDAISYSKGASVIRMLEAFLGRDNFAKGVNQYLKAHQYGNATTIDLWKHLSKASGQNVGEMMKNWTLTVGYPAVHILSETYCKESQDMVLELKQERLLSTGDLKPEEDLAVWFIPISVTTKNGTTKHILSTKTGKICFPYTNDKDDFYKLNSKVTGFYRVCYTVSQLQMLGSGLLNHNSKFSVEDRIGILSEVFSFAKSGLISSSGALELLSGYRNEESYIVLQEVYNRISAMQAVWIQNKMVLDGLSLLVCSIFENKLMNLGFNYAENEGHEVQLKRTLVISALASNGHEETCKELQKMYADYINSQKAIHPELRRIVFKTQLARSTDCQKDFEFVLNLAVKAPTVDERLAALSSIGSINEESLVDKILNEIVFDREIVRLQDFYTPLVSLRGSLSLKEKNIPKLGEWLLKNWNSIHEMLSSSMGLLGNTCKVCLNSAVGKEYLAKYENWFSGNGLTGETRDVFEKQLLSAKRPIMQSLESIESNTAWFNRSDKEITSWVAGNIQ